MTSFDAAAARLRWSRESKDILEIIVENCNAGYSGMRYKIEYVNALVQWDAYDFWKHYSENHLRLMLWKRDLELPAMPSVDSYARLLAVNDVATDVIMVWDRMTVKQLKAALLRHSINFGRKDTKMTLLNALVEAKVTIPLARQKDNDESPTPNNTKGISLPPEQDWTARTSLPAASSSRHPLQAPARGAKPPPSEASQLLSPLMVA